jgi:hypothetical protein
MFVSTEDASDAVRLLRLRRVQDHVLDDEHPGITHSNRLDCGIDVDGFDAGTSGLHCWFQRPGGNVLVHLYRCEEDGLLQSYRSVSTAVPQSYKLRADET